VPFFVEAVFSKRAHVGLIVALTVRALE